MRTLLALSVALTFPLAYAPRAHGDEGVNIRLDTSKELFHLHEPVLLRATYGQDSPGRIYPDHLGWGHEWGYSVEIAKDQGEYFNLMQTIKIIPFQVSRPPTHFEFYSDKHGICEIEPGKEYQRTDMLLLEPGFYHVRAVIKERHGLEHKSNIVTFKVEQNVTEDCVQEVVPEELLEPLSSCIVLAHFMPGMHGEEYPRFSEAIEKLLTQCKDSVYREYVAYYYIRTVGRDRARKGWPITDAKVQQAAEEFVKDYPNSWLLPDVCQVLHYTYLAEKDFDKAIAIAEPVLAVEPRYASLRFVRESVARLKEKSD